MLKFFIIIAIQVVLSGCTTIHFLNTEIPLFRIGSPIRDIPEKTFSFNDFQDQRDTDEVHRKWGAHRYKLDRPATEVVSSAIKQGLERNGHRCANFSAFSNFDFIVQGTLTKYWISYPKTTSPDTVANVIVQLTISTSNDNEKEEYTKKYEGEYRQKGKIAWSGGYDYKGVIFSEMLKQALIRMVDEILADNELIAFIENSSSQN